MKMNSKLQELIEAYDNYLVLLNDELSDLASMAIARGWTSKRVEMGVMCRDAIALCKELLAEEEPSIPFSEMFEFVEWASFYDYYWNVSDYRWYERGKRKPSTTEQLYQLFKQQSK